MRIWDILEVMVAFIDTFIYFLYFHKFLGNLENKIWLGVGCVLMPIILLTSHYMELTFNIKLVLSAGVGIIILLAAYETTFKRVFIASMAWLVTMIMSETAVMGVFLLLHGTEQARLLMTENSISLQAVFMAKIIYFLILMNVARQFGVTEYKYRPLEVLVLVIQAVASSVTILMMAEHLILSKEKSIVSPILLTFLAGVDLIAYLASYQVTENYFLGKEKEKEYLAMKYYEEKELQYYENKKEAELKVRQMYHDINAHLSAIDQMLIKDEEVEDYIDEIRKVTCPIENFYHTGNQVIDIMLHEKQKQAEENNIRFEVFYGNNCLNAYRTMDLCTIFSNAITNAIEACVRQKNGVRQVCVKISPIDEKVALLVQNTYSGERQLINGKYKTTKGDEWLHGIGIGSIQRAVKEHNGSMKIMEKDGRFHLFVMI